MKIRNWNEMFGAMQAEEKSVCVGLDSDWRRLPDCLQLSPLDRPARVLEFNKKIVEATGDITGFFKPNLVFYLKLGPLGLEVLQQTIEFIHQAAPTVPVILDLKCADIDSTNEGWLEFAFDYAKADAITLHPYLGGQSLEPYFKLKDKGFFILCRTSNKGAGELQDLKVSDSVISATALHQLVAYNVSQFWDKNGNCGLVTGATYPQELENIRAIVGDAMPLLIPGLGAQGGEVEATVKAAKKNFVANSSRAIIFASNGPDYAQAARRETQKLHDSITTVPKGERS